VRDCVGRVVVSARRISHGERTASHRAGRAA
jgi:hypothetical protein